MFLFEFWSWSFPIIKAGKKFPVQVATMEPLHKISRRTETRTLNLVVKPNERFGTETSEKLLVKRKEANLKWMSTFNITRQEMNSNNGYRAKQNQRVLQMLKTLQY